MTSRRIHLSVVLFSVAMLVGIVFQNCSGVQFSDVTSTAAPSLEATDTPLDVGTAETKVGARDVPSLKVFVIVDNSQSMRASQVNLAQSFSQLFSSSGSNQLNRFNVTTFLLNTAQTNPDFGSPDLTTISQLQLKSDQIMSSPFSTVASLWRTSTLNSGQVAGDNLGFQILNPSVDAYQFLPAPVLGFSQSSKGTAQFNSGIQKAPNESVEQMSLEFQKRLALLSADRLPQTSQAVFDATGKNKLFQDILDNESGLCGMARLMRNPSGYLDMGDQAVFVLVSDEDDADVAGRRCMQSITKVTQADELIKGRCETRSTVLSYSASQKSPDSCKVDFQTGYSYEVSWSDTVKRTNVTYRRMDQPLRYSSPRTQINFSVGNTVYKKMTTKLNYFAKTCVPTIEDGIRTGERCSYAAVSATVVPGDQSGSLCMAAVRAKGGEVNDPARYPYSCAASEVVVSGCAAGEVGCRAEQVVQPDSRIVNGQFANGSPCLAQAQAIPGAIVDGTRPVTCATASPTTGTGTCPSSLVGFGCVTLNPVYSFPTVAVSGDQSSPTACLAAAQKLTSPALDSANQPRCVVFDQPSLQSRSGTLSFAASLDGGITQSTGDCGALRSRIIPLVAGAPSTSQCLIKSIRTSSNSGLATDPQGACDSVAASHCASSSTPIRSCKGSLIVGGTNTNPVALPSISREVNCDDLCSTHNNVVCAPKSGVVVSATTTVKQYLLQVYGPSATCSARISTLKVSDFADRKVTDKAMICMGSESTPQYLVQDGDPYRLNELVTEHVAGSVKRSANNYDPSMNLVQYINWRSSQLFGASKPLVSAFIRRSSDPEVPGQVGSVGKNYELLAGAMGGRIESVASNDYSPALSALGDVLNKRLERTFSVPKMKPEQAVRLVYLRKVGEPDWKPLAPNLWSANGNTVVLSDSIALNLEDDVKFEFY